MMLISLAGVCRPRSDDGDDDADDDDDAVQVPELRLSLKKSSPN